MNKQFCKQLLESNQSGIYSLIMEDYAKEILKLGPTVFRIWLASELSIDVEKINISSLNSALKRYKNNIEKSVNELPIIKNPATENHVKKDKSDFKFSSIDDTLPKSRTIEM